MFVLFLRWLLWITVEAALFHRTQALAFPPWEADVCTTPSPGTQTHVSAHVFMSGEARLGGTAGGLFVFWGFFCIQNKKVKMNANTSFLGSRQRIVSISAY